MADSDETPGGLQSLATASYLGLPGMIAVIADGPRGTGAATVTAVAAYAVAVVGRDEQALRSFTLGPLGRPDDVAAAMFLASDPSSWFTRAIPDIPSGKIML